MGIIQIPFLTGNVQGLLQTFRVLAPAQRSIMPPKRNKWEQSSKDERQGPGQPRAKVWEAEAGPEPRAEVVWG